MSITVLVTGATGKTGRRLVPLLAGRGVAVRAATRNPGTAAPAWRRRASLAPERTAL